jgi:hypothetical protein
MAFDRLIQIMLGSTIRGGHQFAVHVHEIVESFVVRMMEETDQQRIAPWRLEFASSIGAEREGLPCQRRVEIVVQPGQVQRQHAGVMDVVELGCQADEGMGRGQAGWFFEELEWGDAVVRLNVEERIQSSLHTGEEELYQARKQGVTCAFLWFADEAAQRGGGRDENLVVTQTLLGTCEQG